MTISQYVTNEEGYTVATCLVNYVALNWRYFFFKRILVLTSTGNTHSCTIVFTGN